MWFPLGSPGSKKHLALREARDGETEFGEETGEAHCELPFPEDGNTWNRAESGLCDTRGLSYL